MIWSRTLLTVTVAGAVLLPATTAIAQSADARPTVAVMYFGNGALGKAHEELAPLSTGIADLLITELASNPRIRVVEREELQKLMDEQNLSTGDRVSKETAVKLGKILGAHHMIFGGYVTDLKGNMRLDSRAVNVETSEIEYVETVSDKTDNLMTMISRLADKMNKGMKLPDMPKAVRETSHETAKKVPLQVVMLYSRGVTAESAGNRSEAVQLYRAALDKFPEYEPARRALAKAEKPGT